jgi:hypothetical protein
MKIFVAVDGFKFGNRAIAWVAQLPFAIPLMLRAVHSI